MYNLAPTRAPWFEHLTDSVRALGEAAHEWQLAARHAHLAHAQADVQRRILHEGKATGQPGPHVTGWKSAPLERSPHSHAVFDLQRLYLDLEHRTRREYARAALVFASGAAWAVQQVRAGAQPSRVVLELDDDDRRLLPGSFDANLTALQADRYSKARTVGAAYERLTACLDAGDAAEAIATQDYIADHEASEMHEHMSVAEGAADAAYAYGLLVEEALSFVLLKPRAERRKQLAEQHAAQSSDADTTAGGDE
ncbi:hypothetical protein ACQEV4_42605 [Streptomyces shenzhenensis]|uniref:hypothetical protein n=1 Tax=Streptomyces shenzhenensis TaxID=943815 RepID=UPI003D9047EB